MRLKILICYYVYNLCESFRHLKVSIFYQCTHIDKKLNNIKCYNSHIYSIYYNQNMGVDVIFFIPSKTNDSSEYSINFTTSITYETLNNAINSDLYHVFAKLTKQATLPIDHLYDPVSKNDVIDALMSINNVITDELNNMYWFLFNLCDCADDMCISIVP